MSLKLCVLRVWVTDWPRAVDFYENTLELPPKYRDEKLGWAEFDIGGPGLGIERVAADDPEAGHHVGRFVGATFAVDDIHAKYEQLKAKGVQFDEPPQTQPWGGILAHFKDPDGNVLTLLGMPAEVSE